MGIRFSAENINCKDLKKRDARDEFEYEERELKLEIVNWVEINMHSGSITQDDVDRRLDSYLIQYSKWITIEYVKTFICEAITQMIRYGKDDTKFSEEEKRFLLEFKSLVTNWFKRLEDNEKAKKDAEFAKQWGFLKEGLRSRSNTNADDINYSRNSFDGESENFFSGYTSEQQPSYSFDDSSSSNVFEQQQPRPGFSSRSESEYSFERPLGEQQPSRGRGFNDNSSHRREDSLLHIPRQTNPQTASIVQRPILAGYNSTSGSNNRIGDLSSLNTTRQNSPTAPRGQIPILLGYDSTRSLNSRPEAVLPPRQSIPLPATSREQTPILLGYNNANYSIGIESRSYYRAICEDNTQHSTTYRGPKVFERGLAESYLNNCEHANHLRASVVSCSPPS